MSGFKEREKGFEDKYAHDQDLEFKVQARRNRLLGLWAAQKMGLEDGESYAREVVQADFEEVGEEDVFRKVRGDFDERKVAVTDEEIREQMAALLAQAREEVHQGV